MWLCNNPHAVTKRKAGEHYNKKLKTIPHPWKLPLASCHPGLIILAFLLFGILAIPSASSLWLSLLHCTFGTLCPHYWTPVWSCQTLVRGCRNLFEVHPNIWACGLDVGLDVCYNDALFTSCLHDVHELICSFILEEVERLGNILVSQTKDATSSSISHIHAIPQRNKLVRIYIILTWDTYWNIKVEMI